MKKALLALGCFALAAASLAPALAQVGPKVVQRSVILNTYDHGRYWPDPKKEPVYGKAAWTPNNLNLNFLVQGPLGPGSKLSMEFIKPDGKPWVSVNCITPELAEGEIANIEECDDIDEHKALPMTGVFGVQIRLKNELEGLDSVLYKGKFKVGTYVSKYNKTVQHFIDDDWRVPQAFVAVDKSQHDKAPPLIAYFWFKHRDIDSSDLTAYLYLNGQQVAINTDFGGSANLILEREINLEPADPKQDQSFQLWNFYFMKVRGFNQDDQNGSGSSWYMLDQHPGNYEIKVLHKGKLVRTASFTVSDNGQIVAPGIVEKDGAGNDRIMIPTKVTGAVDSPWNKAAFKTEIFYGNANPKTAGILAP